MTKIKLLFYYGRNAKQKIYQKLNTKFYYLLEIKIYLSLLDKYYFSSHSFWDAKHFVELHTKHYTKSKNFVFNF